MALNPPHYHLMWQRKRAKFRQRFLADRPVIRFAYLTEPIDALTLEQGDASLGSKRECGGAERVGDHRR